MTHSGNEPVRVPVDDDGADAPATAGSDPAPNGPFYKPLDPTKKDPAPRGPFVRPLGPGGTTPES